MQRYPCQVHMPFAANTISHCRLLFHIRLQNRQSTRCEKCYVYLDSTIFPSASRCHLWTWRCLCDLHRLSHPVLTDGRVCSSPAGSWAPWERGSYFAAWQKGHLFTLLCSLALPCEHSQASKRKATSVWHSLDPEVIGRQFGVINLQHDAGVLQRPLPHLRREHVG